MDVNGSARASGTFCCYSGTFIAPVVANGSNYAASLSSFTGVSWNQTGVFLVTLRSPYREGNVFYNVSFTFIVYYNGFGGYGYGNPVSACVNGALTMSNVGGYDINITFVGTANSWIYQQTITYTYIKLA